MAPKSPVTEEAIVKHLQTRPVAVKRIARFLFGRYGSYITKKDLEGQKDEQKKIEKVLSLTLAAHAVAHHAKLDPEEAAACLVDGGQDLGLDAIAFDDREKRCWLFQSKFKQSGQGLLDWCDLEKFLKGFDAIASEDLAGCNAKILELKDEIRRIERPGVAAHHLDRRLAGVSRGG